MIPYCQEVQESDAKPIDLKNYKKLYDQYIREDQAFKKFLDTRNNHGRNETNEKYYFAQNGGDRTKKIKYVHDNITFVLN
jgi:hypothetical protein